MDSFLYSYTSKSQKQKEMSAMNFGLTREEEEAMAWVEDQMAAEEDMP